MIAPITKAAIETISTPPAARSFTRPAVSFFSGETRSVSASMAVLNSSAAKTDPIEKIIQSHSCKFIFKKYPSAIAAIAPAPCIQLLCCVLKK